MKNFSDLFAEEYKSNGSVVKALKAELKLDDISPKTTKRHLDLGVRPLYPKKPQVSPAEIHFRLEEGCPNIFTSE